MPRLFRSLTLLMAALTIASCCFSGCQNPNPSETTELTPVDTKAAQAPAGQAIYESNCASCHGVTGSGASSMVLERQVAFDNPDWQKRYTDAQLITIIKDGKGMMPSFGSSISDADLKTLVTYMRSLAATKP